MQKYCGAIILSSASFMLLKTHLVWGRTKETWTLKTHYKDYTSNSQLNFKLGCFKRLSVLTGGIYIKKSKPAHMYTMRWASGPYHFHNCLTIQYTLQKASLAGRLINVRTRKYRRTLPDAYCPLRQPFWYACSAHMQRLGIYFIETCNSLG